MAQTVREHLEVRSTGSGAEAITLARDAHPDLVLLDLRLPDVPGEEVAREVRAFSSMPILLLTAKSAEEDRIRGLELGADDYVTKPFRLRDIEGQARCPGTRTGKASAGGVTITDGANIDMGHIPFAFAVNPTWHLRNTGTQEVSLGTPKVDVVKGCCPSEPLLGMTTLPPGAETTLQFPTQMHEGMDGDHLFRLNVPVRGSTTPLTVTVAGEFSP